MNKSSSLLLYLYLLHFLIMNKSSYFKKKKKKNQSFLNLSKKKKKIFKKGLGTRGIGLVLLRLPSKKKKKNHQSKFSIPWKNSRFPNFSKRKKKRERKKKKKKKISKLSIPLKNSSFPKKKIFIKFLFRNRKLWSSSIIFSGATSSQLSTPSILWSMEYVPN